MALLLKNVLYSILLFQVCWIQSFECSDSELDKNALKNLIEYLKIATPHPTVNYDDCVLFLKKQAKSLDLPIKIVELHPNNPIVVISWKGTEPEKPSILLNAHMDVVPVVPEKWNYPPFGAEMDKEGNIYARGTQDTKSLTIQHLEAVRRLKLRGIRLKRTVHISMIPDEETGGTFGMKSFVKSKEFRDLNVGFAVDEGSANPSEKFYLYYGERTVFQIWIHCSGTSGHSSVFVPNTAAQKLRLVINRLLDFRESEEMKYQDPKQRDNVTSINLTMLKGGIQINVVPSELSAAFDIRISPFVNHTKFINMIEGWLKEAGSEISYTIISKDPPTESTKLDSHNIYWNAFKKACDENSVKLDIRILPGAIDARYLRALNIPAVSFSPMNDTLPRAHADNEYLNKRVFLRGINIMMKIVESVANV
ncbi:aminoacylase-1A-like [Leptopilina heterotoma]|uniref:aminoacylase-1A-like n=1 Tax=Leptopilina heterotoma TaxID=63436 RepID=UPI001CA8BA5E|nr:aminoacylase-1A-like [Leptopilina heterotoma]